MRNLLATVVLATISSLACSSGVLLQDASLYEKDDLTVIRDGSVSYQFLDLTATNDLSVGDAIAKYSADGFHWASPVEMSSLLSAFGFEYKSAPSASVQLGRADGASWTPATWASASTSFVAHLGFRPFHYWATGFVDDQLTPGHSTWLYINPLGLAYTSNEYTAFQQYNVGTFLVREMPAVPEPATTTLMLSALAVFGVIRSVSSGTYHGKLRSKKSQAR